MTKAIKGLFILLSAALVWGIGNVVTGISAAKYLLSGSLLPAIDISLANTVGGLLFLFVVLIVVRQSRHGSECTERDVPFQRKTQAIVAGALKGINTCFFVFSTTYIVATQSLVCESTYILWSVVLTLLYSRRRLSVTSTILRALLLCVGVLLVSNRLYAFSHSHTLGFVYGILAGLSYAGFLFAWAFVTDRLSTFRSKLISTAWLLVISAVTIVCLTELATLLWQGQRWIPFTHLARFDLIVQTVNGAFVIGVVYLLVTVGMANLTQTPEGPSIIAAFCLSFSIPFTLLPEFIIGKFVPSPLQLVGIGIFMAGFILMSMTLAGSKKAD